MKIFISIFILFLFNACSLKNDKITEVNLKTQTLMFSQKKKIDDENLSFVVTLSYLNPILDEKTKEDEFALQITPNLLNTSHLKAYINDKEAIIVRIKKDSEYLKYLFQNEFTDYFKFSLPSNQNETNLKVKICLNHCFELDFQKYPKSLYYRSEDIDTQYN
ncbi:hypothetical protein [Campylobacter sp. TTU_617]|uniref:hypothetical protein n=1 Tax=Campylobacter sp. TTU_617 TaxID=2768148 RepID=UPI001908D34F|nr:hypothetical protein [Campylobacter sp. TTU_617]MBK1971508.1 hypothetical protein [Campylobacter sp. TTU_617]